jgi:hypothetical protein
VAEADSSGKTEDGGPRLERAAGRSLTDDDDRAGRVDPARRREQVLDSLLELSRPT